MAKLTPNATRTEYGLVINEKIIPWGAVWPKDSGKYKKGQKFKADRRLSGGTGKVAGVTIHNTSDLPSVEEDAEQYTRATWPNANMNDARVHYYIDDINAWQNLEDTEVGWHAGDGSGPGNGTKAASMVLMDGLMQRVSTAEDDFAEMPLDKAGRLIASLSRNATYEKEQKELEISTVELRKTVEACEHQQANIKGFLKLVKSYTEPEQLTPEILHMFIEKIIVHIPEKADGHRIQQVDIFYNFVGQIAMSGEKAKISRRTAAQMAEYRYALSQQV